MTCHGAFVCQAYMKQSRYFLFQATVFYTLHKKTTMEIFKPNYIFNSTALIAEKQIQTRKRISNIEKKSIVIYFQCPNIMTLLIIIIPYHLYSATHNRIFSIYFQQFRVFPSRGSRTPSNTTSTCVTQVQRSEIQQRWARMKLD